MLSIELDTVLCPKLELDVLSIDPETVLRQALELDVLNIEPDTDVPPIFDPVAPTSEVKVTFTKCSAVFVLDDWLGVEASVSLDCDPDTALVDILEI